MAFERTVQGLFALVGSVAVALLAFESLFGFSRGLTDAGFPDPLLLAVIGSVMAILVVAFYLKSGLTSPALTLGAVGTAMAIVGVVLLMVLAFLGYIRLEPT